MIANTPVFYPDHTPHEEGRRAVQSVLEARINPELFEADQMEQLIVSSGANLRHLFSLVNYAADSAILRGSDNGTIALEDCNGEIAAAPGLSNVTCRGS
ncbi:hypothetical protein DO97_02225 [Neosynechococcus sphagnicola sy1]|uniref:Uncharacterized protein n=1 Tax=Neosynechococcus sphagnicola sy1 TaxID=1497020 RepID=A0A098TLM4_9CYAN|nr:hypothetical protein [Neosynechococcus sphagnicola]KGF73156.1 hypothetical protein DO97_02225 [Neosynechococcus sphagnicola sy1]